MKDFQNLDILFSTAKRLAEEAGSLILKEKLKGIRVIRKEKKELVTHLDLVVQNFLIDSLKKEFNEIPIFSEEQRIQKSHENNYWSIDPIDGTHNFIAGLKSYGISIAYIENGEVLIGVIYLPESKELYSAYKGGGSFCNGRRIQCSEISDIEKSIISYDNQFYLNHKSVNLFQRLVDSTFTVRISGCSVVDASYVGEGFLSARIYNSTKLCDVAAGILLVTESGGIASTFSGEKVDLNNLSNLILSGKNIHEELVDICNKSL